MSDDEYPELAAIATLLKTLQPLKEDERTRVVSFVFQKLGMHAPAQKPQDRPAEKSLDWPAPGSVDTRLS